MNWIIRLGQWWEKRKSSSLSGRIAKLEEERQIPAPILKEIALLKMRLDQMELYVGLKREAKPEHVPGAAKIS